MLIRLLSRFITALATSIIVILYAASGCYDPGTIACPPAVLVGVYAHVVGLDEGTYQVDVRKGDGAWESCAVYNQPGNCAVDIVGLVTVRVTADDGRVQTQDVVIKGDSCGPLFPPGVITFTFDSLNG